MRQNGMFVWAELVTDDQVASGEFYSELIGWTRHEQDMGSMGVYTVFKMNGADAAGMTSYLRPGQQGPRWHTYIAVDDVDITARRAEELGATIIEAPMDVPGVGRLCMIRDPQGALISLMTPVPIMAMP